MEALIYDRTQEDLINDTAKGEYVASDLNRIEEWCKYLAETLTSYGYKIDIITKTDWLDYDFPHSSEMERILNNINTLQKAYFSFIQLPQNLDYMTIEKANAIEKFLFNTNILLKNMMQGFVYSGVCGMGQNRIWQQRFRRKYSYMVSGTWNDIEYETWNDASELNWEVISYVRNPELQI